jgi:hypothetical protein
MSNISVRDLIAEIDKNLPYYRIWQSISYFTPNFPVFLFGIFRYSFSAISENSSRS